MTPRNQVTIVIPVAKSDAEWKGLLRQLQSLPAEIILSLASDQPIELDKSSAAIKIIRGPEGRAAQINRAVRCASHSWIWVLHADTRFEADLEAWPFDVKNLTSDVLYFSPLRFRLPRPRFMRLNEEGVRFRSRILLMPFGDQGFLFQRRVWQKLGEFSESAPYGEDHLFVWRWRQSGRSIKALPFFLWTSARKYQEKGWLAITQKHVALTFSQALPQFLSYVLRSL